MGEYTWAVVARLEQMGLQLVVLQLVVLQLAAVRNADTRLLSRDGVHAAAVPFCNFVEALVVERAARTVDQI